MVDGGDTIPAGALDDVAYLARSANRVRILAALTSEAYTRRALAEETGTSRTTLDRIVNELAERGWVERTDGGDYAATAVGAALMEEFEPFVDAVAAIDELGEAVAWLPDEKRDVGLESFADAEVWQPDHGDPQETVDYMTDLVRDAEELRALTHLVPPDSFLRAMREGVEAGYLSVDGVVPAAYAGAYLDQPERREHWRAILEHGADLHLTDEALPCNLWIVDGTVLIKDSGDGPIEDTYGQPIVSTDARVRSWAHDLIDRYRKGATRVDPEMLAAWVSEDD